MPAVTETFSDEILPATGKEMNTGDVSQVEPNIHAGVKYISMMRDEFFGNEPMDSRNKTLFAFAAYNAGPSAVRKYAGVPPYPETMNYVSRVLGLYEHFKEQRPVRL